MNEDQLQQRRRDRLAQWLAAHGGLAQVARARRLSPSYQSYLSQVRAGHSFGSRGARSCEERLGMPQLWLDQAQEPATAVAEPGGAWDQPAVPLRANAAARVTLRQALQALCEELRAVEPVERREGVGALLRACAISGGDFSYIDPIISVMQQTLQKATAAGRA